MTAKGQQWLLKALEGLPSRRPYGCSVSHRLSSRDTGRVSSLLAPLRRSGNPVHLSALHRRNPYKDDERILG
jgi:hypothetical protein